MAVTACVGGGSQIRAILLCAASLMRLDTQEVEGLNSIIKTCVARAQNNRLTLPLLSARVCMRKVISLHTNGSTRVKDIKPYAAVLARSAFLYGQSGSSASLGDDDRFRPPSSGTLSLRLPQAEYDRKCDISIESATWAMKYHAKLIKTFKQFWKAKTTKPCQLLALVVPSTERPSSSIYFIGCTIARSQVIMIRLRPDDNVPGKFLLTHSLTDPGFYQQSLAILSSLHDLVELRKKQSKPLLKLQTHLLEVCASDTVQDCCRFTCVGKKNISVICVEDT